MFLRLLLQSFVRQRRRKLLAGIAVMLGTAIVTAMVAVSTAVGDKINAEIRTVGANIVVFPLEDTLDVQVGGRNLKPATAGAFLAEADLTKIKQIFWSHNIIGYTPILETETSIGGAQSMVPIIGTYFNKPIALTSGVFHTGVTKTHRWWEVEGSWPADDSRDVLLGHRLATKLKFRPGDRVYIGNRETQIAGILTTGSDEEDAIVGPLPLVQQLIGRPGAVRRVYVSALTKPEDDFARRDPRSMSAEVLERWSCSPYANSIAYQIGQAMPNARAEQIRAVAQNEGVVLSRISGLMLLLAIAALVAAALAVSASMASTMLERQREIGLMRSLGAANSAIGGLFFAEAFLLALIAGSLGFFLGWLLAQRISWSVFNSGIDFQVALWPVMLLAAGAVTFAGSTGAVLRSMRLSPSIALRGDGA
jgi:putative ABC transport system permease protein